MTSNAGVQAGSSAFSPLVLLCLGATWFIWGTMFLAIKWALVSFPPFYQMGTQFLAAGTVLAIVARARGAAWPDRQQWAGGAVLGCLLLGAGYGFTALAETSVSSGLVVAFTAIVPTMIALLEWLYGIRPPARQRVGIAIGLVGIVMMTQGQGFAASLPGLLAIVAACVGWVLGTQDQAPRARVPLLAQGGELSPRRALPRRMASAPLAQMAHLPQH